LGVKRAFGQRQVMAGIAASKSLMFLSCLPIFLPFLSLYVQVLSFRESPGARAMHIEIPVHLWYEA